MMMKHNDGGPAFPQDGKAWLVGKDAQGFDLYQYGSGGMSLRDYFAAAALTGFCAAHNDQGDWAGNCEQAAQEAYKMADFMLKARCEPQHCEGDKE
jgi:hypothetical protein